MYFHSGRTNRWFHGAWYESTIKAISVTLLHKWLGHVELRAPPLAEAYYQNIPLIVITADRPAKWIDQGEGQSIRQSHLLDGILIKAVDLVNERSEDDAWYNRRLVNEAFESAWTNQKPVQINVPLNEPLYNTMHWERPLVNRGFSFVRSERLLSDGDLNGLLTIWSQRSRVMILMGQNSNEERIKAHIKTLSEHPNVAVLTESTAKCWSFWTCQLHRSNTRNLFRFNR